MSVRFLRCGVPAARWFWLVSVGFLWCGYLAMVDGEKKSKRGYRGVFSGIHENRNYSERKQEAIRVEYLRLVRLHELTPERVQQVLNIKPRTVYHYTEKGRSTMKLGQLETLSISIAADNKKTIRKIREME